MTKTELGLTSAEAEKRLKTYGLNALAEKKKKSVPAVFFNQFKDVMVLILIAATVISVVMGETYDALTILVIVILNATLGFVQEIKTEKTLEALHKLSAPTANVYRDGSLTKITSDMLTIGDVVRIEAGSRIPADCRVLSETSIECDESILTGESFSVKKERSSATTNALNQSGVVYMGTTVAKGYGIAEVIAIGVETQMGKVSKLIESVGEEQSPLQKKLGELGKIIGAACIIICVIVALAGILRGYEAFDMLLVGLSLAVAAIPEGLPATVTICLALSVRRMYKRNVLVNKLHSVETLGCTEIICTDKTGTLTKNKMTVACFYSDGTIHNYPASEKNDSFEKLFSCAKHCNNAIITDTGMSGDPTETALLSSAIGYGIPKRNLKRTDEIPFDSKSRFMEVTVQTEKGSVRFLKGAPDVVMSRCRLVTETDGNISAFSLKAKKAAEHAVETMTGKALRTLAFAADYGGGYVFLGLIGMSDPLRPEIKQAVRKCKSAGIRTVMLTGDHKNTAAEIAKQAGISSASQVVTGAQIDVMSDERLCDTVKEVSVFARVSPENKLRLVRAFKKLNKTTAMTGDGVNDAPAVKEAAIGVAMGIQGTDVTKEAAKLVLLDDDFSSLVTAVEEGRAIYANIRKFIRYMLSCNIGEVLTMLVAMLMGLPVVLLPIQLLLINLVTDGLPAIALGVEPTTDNLMNSPPRKSGEGIFSHGLSWKIMLRGVIITALTLISFNTALNGYSLETARTAALTTLGLSQLFFVFECKDERRGIFNADFPGNKKLLAAVFVSVCVLLAAVFLPALNDVFKTQMPEFSVFTTSALLAAAPSALRGIYKLFVKDKA